MFYTKTPSTTSVFQVMYDKIGFDTVIKRIHRRKIKIYILDRLIIINTNTCGHLTTYVYITSQTLKQTHAHACTHTDTKY